MFAQVMRLLSSPAWIAKGWASLDLARQFLLGASVVVLTAMTIIGWWVSQKIERSVTENTAHAAALFMESSVAPLIQGLASADDLDEQALQQLHKLFADPAIRERVVSMKIWSAKGTILYSTFPDMIGKSFPPSENFRKALSGAIAAEFDNEPHVEDHHERGQHLHLLEIYAPLREFKTRKIIAVSEFYANGDKLEQDILQARRLSWLVSASVTLAMLSALYMIVLRGSRTIERQKKQLTAQVLELQALLQQNEELRGRLQDTSSNVAEVSERILQRLGADLHDGPAQLLTYALLRFNTCASIVERSGDSRGRGELQAVRAALQDTLREVRNLSEGLSLPELHEKTVEESVRLAVEWHRQHTNTQVSFVARPGLPTASHALNVCLFRFVQEGLANAFHHAGAIDQRVMIELDGALTVSVSDGGPGLMARDDSSARGLGLLGLRARVEASGGTFGLQSKAGEGTRLTARFALDRM
jgi:signal transduction histidine kinase